MRLMAFGCVALALGLAACQPPDPLASVRAKCGDEHADNAARAAACSALIDSGKLDDKDRAWAQANRGAATLKTDVSAALRDFIAAQDMDPTNLQALEGRATILLASGQLDAAEPMVEKLIAAGDTSGRAQAMKGDIALRRSNYAAAIAAYDEAIKQDGRSALAYAGRARAKLHSDDEEGALSDFDHAISINGDLADARSGRCWLRITQAGKNRDNDGPARADAEAAVHANRASIEAQLCLGIVQLRAGQWDQARDTYSVAVELEPGNPSALFGRGVARRRGGDGQGTQDMNQARDFDHHISEKFSDMGVDTF